MSISRLCVTSLLTLFSAGAEGNDTEYDTCTPIGEENQREIARWWSEKESLHPHSQMMEPGVCGDFGNIMRKSNTLEDDVRAVINNMYDTIEERNSPHIPNPNDKKHGVYLSRVPVLQPSNHDNFVLRGTYVAQKDDAVKFSSHVLSVVRCHCLDINPGVTQAIRRIYKEFDFCKKKTCVFLAYTFTVTNFFTTLVNYGDTCSQYGQRGLLMLAGKEQYERMKAISKNGNDYVENPWILGTLLDTVIIDLVALYKAAVGTDCGDLLRVLDEINKQPWRIWKDMDSMDKRMKIQALYDELILATRN